MNNLKYKIIPLGIEENNFAIKKRNMLGIYRYEHDSYKTFEDYFLPSLFFSVVLSTLIFGFIILTFDINLFIYWKEVLLSERFFMWWFSDEAKYETFSLKESALYYIKNDIEKDGKNSVSKKPIIVNFDKVKKELSIES